MNCAICREELISNKHKLECEHVFHLNCIISWFRSGNGDCPLCRASPHTYLTYHDIRSRAKIIRRQSRGKNVPKKLKKIVQRLRKIEEKVKELIKKKYKIKIDNRDIFKSHTKLCKDVRRAKGKLRMTEKELGLYEDDNIKVPFLKKIYYC